MNYAWIHLGSVHFPIALAVISMLLVIFALITRSPARLKFALELVVIGALFSWVPYRTGEDAEDVVKQTAVADVDLKHFIHEHEEWAERAHIAFQVSGGLALLGWFFCRKTEKFNMPLAVLALLAIGTTAGLMGWTGHLGGKVRHTEVRSVGVTQSDRPAGQPMSAAPAQETEDDDDR